MVAGEAAAVRAVRGSAATRAVRGRRLELLLDPDLHRFRLRRGRSISIETASSGVTGSGPIWAAPSDPTMSAGSGHVALDVAAVGHDFHTATAPGPRARLD